MYSISIPEVKTFLQHVAVGMHEPVMLWGQPGVGKSEAIWQLTADNNGILCDVRLSQYDSVDLRGIPVPTDEELTVWHAPSTLPFKCNDRFDASRMIVLFLDEINAATPAVAAVAYQLINERRVGEHELMDNVVVIAAGNREGDKGVTNRMPLPLANRFTHVEVVTDVDAFCLHLQAQQLPAIGVAFMQFRKPLLSTFDPSKPDKAFATPRTWVKALRYFANDTMPNSVKQAAIAGAVGEGPAAEFWGFVEIWKNMVSMAEIEAHPKTTELPKETAMCYAVAVAISGHMSTKNVAPLHTYLSRMDPEFVVMAWQLAVKRDPSLFSVPEFLKLATEFKAVFSPS
jgi:hypothetical protein